MASPSASQDLDNMRNEVVGLLQLAKFGGVFAKRLRAQIPELERNLNEIDRLIATFQKFDGVFAQHGFIQTSRSPTKLSAAALELHEKGETQAALELLETHFLEENVRIRAMAKELSYVNERFYQIDEAVKLTEQKNYYALVPLLLAVTEGIFSDAFGELMLFRDGAKVVGQTNWIGNGSVLQQHIEWMSKPCKRTSSDDCLFPYRHGILHGKMLRYGNRRCAAIAWSTYFNIVDLALQSEKHAKIKAEKDKVYKHSADQVSDPDRKPKDERINFSCPIKINLAQDYDWQSSDPVEAVSSIFANWHNSRWRWVAMNCHPGTTVQNPGAFDKEVINSLSKVDAFADSTVTVHTAEIVSAIKQSDTVAELEVEYTVVLSSPEHEIEERPVKMKSFFRMIWENARWTEHKFWRDQVLPQLIDGIKK